MDGKDIEVSRGLTWLIAFAAALSLYGATRAPGVLWGDAGEAQVHVLMGGWYVDGQIARSHVLFYALARAFRWLTGLDAAQSATWISALAGAATVANGAWLLSTFCRIRTAVAGGALLLMFSHTLWHLSTTSEVVTVSTALLLAELIFLVKLAETGWVRWLAGVALANGLGLSNHNFALLMWPVYAVVAWRHRRGVKERWIQGVPAILGMFLLGASGVLALCVDDLLTRNSVALTLKSWLVGEFAPAVWNFAETPKSIARAVLILILNFPTPVLLAIVPGIRLMTREWPRPVLWALIGGLLVYGAFGARYRVPDQHTFLVPAMILIAVLAGVGLDALLRVRRTWVHHVCVLLLSAPAPIAYAVGPPLMRAWSPQAGPMPRRTVPYRDRFDWFLHPWRVGDDGAGRFAREALSVLPENAWLVVDVTLLPSLNYLQAAEGLRRDVRLDSPKARQPWLAPVPPDEGRKQSLADGRLFVASDDPRYHPSWLRDMAPALEPAGLVYLVKASPR